MRIFWQKVRSVSESVLYFDGSTVLPANRSLAIRSRSPATALTRTVKLWLPAVAGSLRRPLATVRRLRAAASSLLLACELTAEFHWLIA